MALTKISTNLVADDAIVTGKIADGGVATADLAANAVTTAKIAQNNVTAHHIADGSVTTTQLGADSVTNAKIADDAISEEHLDKTIISDLTEVTAVNGDFLMIGDTSDSNNLKKVPVSSLPGSAALPLAGGTMTGDLIINDGARSLTYDVSAGELNHAGATFHINKSNGVDVAIGNDDLYVDMSTSRVGIGTTSPSNLLTLKSGSNCDMEFGSESGGNFIQTYNRTTSAYGYLRFTTGGTPAETMRLTADGNVGIGTDNPDRLLTLQGDNSYMWMKDAGGGNVAFIGGDGGNDGFLRLYNGSHDAKIEFNSSGDSYISGGSLHIGTTDSIASSAEIFSVYSAGTGHSKMVNSSDSYSTLYLHNESTTADTFQPFITFQKGGGNRGNIGVRHTDSVLGIQGQGGISFRTPSTSVQSSTERLNIGSDGFAKLAGGCGIGALHNTGQNVANSFVNFFDFSTLAPGSGQERGMYLVSMSRNGGSVGTRILAYIGVSTNSTVYVYEILASAGSMSLQSNGSSLQVKTGSSSNQSIQGTAIPVAIDHN